MKQLFTSSNQKVLSSLFTNLAAGWIGALLILPNFSDLSKLENQLILIFDILAVIVCLILAFVLEENARE